LKKCIFDELVELSLAELAELRIIDHGFSGFLLASAKQGENHGLSPILHNREAIT
jgi:hypothetical protein